MTKVNTCEIFNQADDKFYTLYIEWHDSHFEVTLLEPSMLSLNGKMDTEDMKCFCKELSKSLEDYVQETEEIFCGKRKEIHFHIDKNRIEWKNNLWTLGKIDLNPVSDIKVISKIFQRSLKFYQDIQRKLSNMEEENETLIEENMKLKSDIDKMIEAKTIMEQDMYKKFILLLNSKKKKIQELECKKEQNTREPIYDAPTDESEESDTGDVTTNKKRKTTDNKDSAFPQKRKYATNEVTSPKPSTSTEYINDDITVKKNVINDDIEVKKYVINDDIEVKNNVTNDDIDVKKIVIKGEDGSMKIDQSCTSESRKSTCSLNLDEAESDEDLFSS